MDLPVRSLYLCRHGQDEDNAEGLLNGQRNRPLTALGREQAAAAADFIRTKYPHIDVILCSPLSRATDTALAIAQGLPNGQPVPVLLDLLKERNFGVMSGKPIADIVSLAGGDDNVIKTDKVTYFLEVEGGENFPTLLKRAEEVLDYLKRPIFSGQNVLLVCHGDIGKMIRAAFHQWTWQQGLQTPYFANTEVLELKPFA